MSTSNLILKLYCQHGIVKTHAFQVEATQLVEAAFSPINDGPNHFSMRPTLLQGK